MVEATIRFTRTVDGKRIAYAAAGRGRPYVVVRGFVTHLERMWQSSDVRSFFEPIAATMRLVRYDSRGNGLSDLDVGDLQLQHLVWDLEAVLADLGEEPVVLHGSGYGGPIALAYAAANPGRVERLILDGTYARGDRLMDPRRREAFLTNVRDMPEAAFLFVDWATSGSATPLSRADDYRAAIGRDAAVRLYELGFQVDVSNLLEQIHVPTLVLHRRDSRAFGFQLGRELASAIPNATLVSLPGTAHNLWAERPDVALDAIGRFLNVGLVPAGSVSQRSGSVTILVTDVQGSTPLTQRLGDEAAQGLLRIHNEVVRGCLTGRGGSEIKHTGDGIMAVFTSSSSALACAVDIQRHLAERSAPGEPELLRVRIGLNAGEPIAEEDDLFGSAVQLAHRIATYAEGGRILVSDVVRQLVAGRGFVFGRPEAVSLKGFDDPVLVSDVQWAATATHADQ